ncbi:unnamed protein product [Clonostachys byssicola]|uniref:AAA+ ATPase domain-containing protein n=1 Tax=Clonostachys byssicola TaxID=160290 RepID=A0A9N9UI40_9HYPO|nr:unnamed protein product [Clonostachys byssicola]
MEESASSGGPSLPNDAMASTSRTNTPAINPTAVGDRANGDDSDANADAASKHDENTGDNDEPESFYQAAQLANSLLWMADWEKELGKEKLRGKMRLRSRQAMIHVASTEYRLLDVETKLGELQEKLEKGRNDFKDQGREDCPVFMPALSWTPIDEFRNPDQKNDLPPIQLPAIEILYSQGSTLLHSQDNVRRDSTSGQPENQEATAKIPERVRIRSWSLLGHLEKICGETFSLAHVTSIESRPSLVLLRPFKVLFLFEQAIRDSVSKVKIEVENTMTTGNTKGTLTGAMGPFAFEWKHLLADLNLLIEVMDTALQPTYKLRQSVDDATLEDIAYPDLWHLFRVGDIITRRDANHQAFKVLGIAGGREPLATKMNVEDLQSPPIYGFAIDCMSVSYDGSFYVPRLHKFNISKFTGLKKIPALEVYPIRFDPDASAIKDQLMSNGERYLDLTRRPYSHVTFRGRTVDDTPEEIEGQVVIDVAMALRTEPDWRPPPVVNEEHLTKPDLRETFLVQACRHQSLNAEGCCGGDIAFKDQTMNIDQRNPKLKAFTEFMRPRTEGELADDLILLPNSIYGFVLRLRKWVTVQTRDLSDVAFDNDFNNLMMNEKQKQAILALVETHEKARLSPGAKKHSIGASLDLVTGKGTGLILLLHGEPGVGKTSTAECVADRTKRPLFPITCGDIGEAAMEVERNLQHNFRLAHRWGCVLLLDESDIFLAKRNKTDLRRNAVTSVFLRSLDYYAGILFLTTNRVGGIDPAFKSRIHLSVFYPRLDLDRTQKLFDVFLRKTKEEQRKSGVSTFDIKSKEISRFAKRNYRSLKKSGFNTWNGRQIRNAFQTAIALVEYDVSQMQPGDPKPSLGKKQFEVVAEGSRQFDDYLMRTLQGRDADIAIRDQWRDDTFELQELGHATPLRSELPTTKKLETKFKSAKDELSVTESDSGSDSGESGDEEENGEDRGVSVTSKAGSGRNEMEEYQQFLEFQAMKRAMEK